VIVYDFDLHATLKVRWEPDKPDKIHLSALLIPKCTRSEGSLVMAIDPITVDLAHDVLYAAVPTAGGNPVPATLTWTSSDTTILELIVSPDTLGALAVTKAAGTATVTVAAGTVTNESVVTVVPVPPPPVDAIGLTGTIVPKA
jgi:hypothetical protein